VAAVTNRASRLCAALAAVGAFGLGACVSAPPACVTTRSVQVCAESHARASDVAHQLDLRVAELREQIPDLLDIRPEIWLQDRPQIYWFWPMPEEYAAVTHDWTKRIHAKESAPDLIATLTHELIHALLGESWQGLPPTLEEGLCDAVAIRLNDDRQLRSERLLIAIAAVGEIPLQLRLHAPDGGWHDHEVTPVHALTGEFELLDTYSRNDGQVSPIHSDAETPFWYGLGFIAMLRLIERHGLDGVHDLVQRAAKLDEDDSIALFAEASGLDDEPSQWRRAILDEIDADVLGAFAAETGAELGLQAMMRIGLRPGEESLEERFAAARPELRVKGRDVRFDLMTVPEFADMLALSTDADPDAHR
jgi:hypothetical protein